MSCFFYGISLMNIAVNISMVLIFVVAVVEQSNELTQKKAQMNE